MHTCCYTHINGWNQIDNRGGKKTAKTETKKKKKRREEDQLTS